MRGLLDRAADQYFAMHVPVLINFARILDRHDRGVSVSPEEVAAIVMGRRADVADDIKAAAGDGRVQDNKGGYTLVNGVAVLAIGGVLMKYASQVNGSSQPRGTSVESIRKSVQAAAKDTEASAILLVIDSPGGSVMGMATLADEIRQIDQTVKPVYAFCDDLCCSGGYYIASQARRIDAGPSAVVGSIGVYTVLVDDSRAAEEQGLRMSLVAAGKYKGALAEGVAITDQAKQEVQREIDAFYEEFTLRVARGRAAAGLTQADVLELADGRVHIGRQALDARLVDSVRPLGQVLGEIAQKHGKGGVGARAGASAGAGVNAGSVSPLVGGENTGPGRAGGAGSTSGTNAGVAGQEQVMDKDKDGGGQDLLGKVTQEQASKAAEAANAAGIKAERERVTGINKLAAKFSHVAGVLALATAAVEKDTSVAAFQESLLDKVASVAKPIGAVGVSVGEDGSERHMAHMVTALVHRQTPGLRELFARGGEQAEAMANRLGYEAANGRNAAQVALAEFREVERNRITGMRLVDMMRACVAARDPEAAKAAGFDDRELFRLAMGQGSRGGIMAAGSNTTSDFPAILANVANKTLLARFEEEGTTWDQWCAEGTANDYKDGTMVSLSDAQDLKLILEGEFAKKVSFNERKQTISVAPYGLRFGMTYQMMRNDDLNAFSAIPALFGAASKRLPEILVYLLLESQSGTGPTMGYDSTALIATGHGNLNTGAALSYAAAQAAVVKMRTQTGFGKDKTILNIKPTFLIVPPALEFTAGLLYKNTLEPNASVQSNANLLQGLMQPVVVGRLAASATRWWVAGPKNNSSIEVRFLDGQRTPRIDTITNGNPLEQEFQVTLMGVGVGARNHENISSNAGV